MIQIWYPILWFGCWGFFGGVFFSYTVGTENWLALLSTLIFFDPNNIHPSLLFFKALLSCSKVSKWINFLIFHSRRLRFESVIGENDSQYVISGA